jgi:hypothetical protein
MLYGYNKGLQTIVTAASSLEEFKEWQSELEGHLYREANETDFMEHLTNPDYQKLAGSAIVVEFDHEYNQGEFTRIHEIVLLQPAQAVDRNVEMIHYEKPDVFDAKDERTIEEIHGLDKEDRWDHRDEAEMAEDKAMREKIKEMKKNDELSGESFSAPKKDGIGVQRVDVSHDADGNVQIDHVLAQKYTGTELEDQIEGSTKLADAVAADAALEGERKQQRKVEKKKELEAAVERAKVLGK